MTDTNTAERMIGTDGGLDYVVVARRGRVALGLRFLPVILGECLAVLVRVRSAPDPNLAPDDAVNVTGMELVTTWQIPFENMPTTPGDRRWRASLYCILPLSQVDMGRVAQAFVTQRAASKIREWLSRYVEEGDFEQTFSGFSTLAIEEMTAAASRIAEQQTGVELPIPEDVSAEFTTYNEHLGHVKAPAAPTGHESFQEGAQESGDGYGADEVVEQAG